MVPDSGTAHNGAGREQYPRPGEPSQVARARRTPLAAHPERKEPDHHDGRRAAEKPGAQRDEPGGGAAALRSDERHHPR